MYQLKIVAALISHRFLLGKRVSLQRWLSVLLLTLGVVLVQLSTIEPSAAPTASAAAASSSSSSSGAAAPSSSGAAAASSSSGAASSSSSGASCSTDPLPVDDSKKRNLGLAAVLAACCCSGLAGAVMEKLLKSDAQSLGTRNLQVGVVSLILASIHLLSNDREKLQQGGFFQGYTPLVCPRADSAKRPHGLHRKSTASAAGDARGA